MARLLSRLFTLGAVTVAAGAFARSRARSRRLAAGRPPGKPKRVSTAVLETGARLLQELGPVRRLDVHLVGFHPMKSDPDMQMEAHHYCQQVNEDFMQCVLFDGEGEDARLNGVEFIISERLYATLPPEEKPYWHPHNYEILSGQLVAPRLPEAAEKELMRRKVNSYGKTWHFWMTGGPRHAAEPLPLGEPQLAWSFNRDGEADTCLLCARDARLGTDTERKREERADLARHAHPQEGEEALKDAFPLEPAGPEGTHA